MEANASGGQLTPPSTPPPAYPQRFFHSLLSFEEAVVFCIYPVTICLGSLVSVLSQPDTYFSNKRNIFNTIFVKNGWFWTSFVFMIHCIRLRASKPAALGARYAVITIWWFLFTQWFLGPPIMDRIFIQTGGMCFVADPDMDGDSGRPIHEIWSSVGCRHLRGDWAGGHDVSGHSFILTHSSLFLWYELLPVIVERGPLARQINTKIVLGLLALWWWMLLMTATYFHTFAEKVTGWAFGLVAWAFVYGFGPHVRTLRAVMSVPGV
ncbi:inositol phospholipid synthesis and fat-storage-inducing TM-domain-containing protein [Limtongia smithiae]|uniref:inositol phospholipid synthesis and fat-storage-inducing TM-domain-containing protein n=1 Tax=Limtongia smithiae TaxID=1125753 RepID=UPI0034CD2A09